MSQANASQFETTNRRPIASLFRRLGALPVKWCVKLGIHPNVVSLMSLVASAGAAYCFWMIHASPWLGLVGVSLCFLRLYFNMLDGMVALAANKTSATGHIANELPDRISDVLIFTSVAAMTAPALAYWCAILSLLVAYVGTLGQSAGAHRDFSGPMSKPWRMVLLAIGVIGSIIQASQPYGPPMVMAPISCIDIACLVIALGCVVTIVRRLVKIIRQLRANEAEVL